VVVEELRSAGLSICPRCGMPYNWVESRRRGNNTYYYAVHRTGRGADARKKKCYLGPHLYKNVSVTHENLGITLEGLITAIEDGGDVRALKYLESFITYVMDVARELKIAELERAIELLREAREVVRKALERRELRELMLKGVSEGERE